LDEVFCEGGSRILDIGCGYGRLLEAIRRRHGNGVGITISPEQVKACRRRGLDVRLLDYKDIGRAWNGRFDAAVANGSIEHFAQPPDAAASNDDRIYRHLFQTVHRVVDPDSSSRRFVTTTIHFVRRPVPEDLRRNPFAFRRGSDQFHWALLARTYGGWYPEIGQLEQSAAGFFDLVNEVDGTDDYRLTSEHWLKHVRARLKTAAAARIAVECLPVLLRHPMHFATAFLCVPIMESWNWQFRGSDPPTRLLRQTWEYCD